MKKTASYLTAAAVLLICTALIFFPAETSSAVRRACTNCLNTIIPSLFAMMVMSRITISSGLYKELGRPFGPVSRYIFRIPEELFPIFLISSAAGYPVGAALLTEGVRTGEIRRSDAEHMLGWCFGAGPAFIVGTVGAGIFGSVRCGGMIFLSCFAANLLIGAASGIGRAVPERTKKHVPPHFSAEMLNISVTGGGEAVLKMCAAVLFMSALLSIPDSLKISVPAAELIAKLTGADPRNVLVFMRSAAEVTNLTFLRDPSRELLPAAAAAVSFGGISVFMQISSVCSGEISLKKMIFLRFGAAALSYIICGMLCGKVFTETAVPVMVENRARIRHNPPLSSVFLLIMTILLLSKKNVAKAEKI